MTTAEQWLARGLRPLHVRDYIYRSVDGEPIVRKRRFQLMNVSDGKDSGQKTFSVQHRSIASIHLGAETWEPEIGPWSDGLLYHRPELDEAVRSGDDIYICEGEKDADSVAKAWEVVTTTHYQGAAGWRADQAQVFKGHRGFVWIVMDNDTVGVQIAWRTWTQLAKVGLGKDQFSFIAPDDTCDDIATHVSVGLGMRNMKAVPDHTVQSFIRTYGELPVRRPGSYYGYSAGDREFAEALREYGWEVRRADQER